MITPELIAYIRAEMAAGKVRDEIQKNLLSQGGWTADDMNEAFRTVIPMQGFAQSSFSATPAKSSFLPKILFFLILAVCGGLGWFYFSEIKSFTTSSVNSIEQMLGLNKTENVVAPVVVIPPPTPPVENPLLPSVKDCGVSTESGVSGTKTYKDDPVFVCLGESAKTCSPAKGVLQGDLLPKNFSITKQDGKDTCDFTLEYPAQSSLVDLSGNKLALQYISCPLTIVKALDTTKKALGFTAPHTSELGLYAGEIYSYGALGIFIENNFDENKIKSLGCYGPLIDSVVATYKPPQPTKPVLSAPLPKPITPKPPAQPPVAPPTPIVQPPVTPPVTPPLPPPTPVPDPSPVAPPAH